MNNKQAQKMLADVTPDKFARVVLERAIRLSCRARDGRLDTNTLKSALNKVIYGKYNYLFDFSPYSLEGMDCEPTPNRGLDVSFTMKVGEYE